MICTGAAIAPRDLGGFDVLSVRITSPLAFISKLSLKKRNASRNITLKSKTEETQRLNLQATRLEEKIDYDQLTSEKKADRRPYDPELSTTPTK